MTTLPFRIDATPVGGRIEIAGEDVTDRVAQTVVTIDPLRATVVTLHHAPGTGPIEGEGIIQVAGGDPGLAVLEFLDLVDPHKLEAEALMALDVSQNGTAAMLDVLRRWARGEQ
jgi:hypothetical protein